jgi:hypothetical protein
MLLLFIIFESMSKRSSFIYYFTFFLCFSMMLCSCSSENSITSSFSSRKYTQGYFVNTPGSIEKVATNDTKPSKITTARPIEARIVKQNVLHVNNVLSPVVASSQIQPKAVVPQQKSKNDFTCMIKSLKLNVADTVNDSLDDGYAKEQRTNRVLGIIGFTTAVAGAVFIFVPEFIVAALLVAAGFVISAIGIRRGSNSLFAFFGFIISILGIVVLLDILIAVKQ